MDYSWRPQKGTQLRAITATWCEELFFGGARGGGKTSYLLGDYAQDVNIYKSAWKGILFRRTYKELEEVIYQSYQIYTRMGAIFKAGEKIWVFPNGATLKLRAMEREQDADKYQGHQYVWIGFDELPNWPTDIAYNKLKACLRSSDEVEYKRIRSTGNPGGVGHNWVKSKFIDPCPEGFKPIDNLKYINIYTGEQSEKKISGSNWQSVLTTRIYIPSKITDNKILLDNDPGYIARLTEIGSKELVRAWLAGDWNAIEGCFFEMFSTSEHVIENIELPSYWYKIRSFDWGSARPSCTLWGGVSDGKPFSYNDTIYQYPKGAIIIYREYYTCEKGKNNIGLKLDPCEIADKINECERYEEINDAVADPAIFSKDGSYSIAQQLEESGVYFRRGKNARIDGWQEVRYRLNKNLLFITKGCYNLIRTLPTMQHDVNHYEDLDSELEDHAVDSLRYMCMSRPIINKIPFQEECRALPNNRELLGIK